MKTKVKTYRGSISLRMGIRRMEKRGWSVAGNVDAKRHLTKATEYLVTFQKERS